MKIPQGGLLLCAWNESGEQEAQGASQRGGSSGFLSPVWPTTNLNCAEEPGHHWELQQGWGCRCWDDFSWRAGRGEWHRGVQHQIHCKIWRQGRDFENFQVARRPSLPPPPNSGVTWTEYQSSVPGKPLTLGRKVVAKASSKQFKATVAMSEDFPMKVDMLLAVLEVIAPQFKHFNKLRDFVKLKLPPGKKKGWAQMLKFCSGFPIQVNIPVLPTVSAKVCRFI